MNISDVEAGRRVSVPMHGYGAEASPDRTASQAAFLRFADPA
jgi:hypothetical protein